MVESLRNYSFRRVEAIRDWIIQFCQEYPLFQEAVLDHYTEYSENSVNTRLRLNDQTYADCFYTYESDGSDNERMVAQIPMIMSELGYSTGFFLFHLQLVIAVVAGVSEITLDNDTDEPQRARKGIYQLFELNTRTMDNAEKARMTAHNWAVMPEMFHRVKRTSLGRIQRVLLERITRAVSENGAMEVWRPDAVDHLTLMFRKLRQKVDLYSGGMARGTRKSGTSGTSKKRGKKSGTSGTSKKSKKSKERHH